MKKYEKPMIVLEKFELNHSIANCSPAMNHSETACKYESDELEYIIGSDETVFNSGDCVYSLDYFLSVYDGYCLQTAAPEHTLFTS